MIGRTLAALLVCAGAAHAQDVAAPTAPASDVVVYEPSFFEPFAPRTALDMVRRVPGFSISESEERRGFSGAVQNVLIDGAPPAAKQEIEDILERIPAGEIIRIEVIRGAGASAASAHSVRVNVVRRAGEGEGVWLASIEGGPDARLSPNVEAALSGRRGLLDYSFAGSFEQDEAPARGRRLELNEDDELVLSGRESLRENEREARLSGELAAPLVGGKASLTTQFNRVELAERLSVDLLTPVDELAEIETADTRERDDVFEIGASLERAYGPWSTEIAGILTRRRVRSEEESVSYDGEGTFEESEREERRIRSGETILRAEASRALPGRAQLKVGAEAAFNTLEQQLRLFEDVGSGEVPVLLPSANVRVAETRGEAFATFILRLGARWTFDAGVSGEASRLEQSGDVARTVEFFYWKPSLQIARAIGDDDQVRLRFYRDVGQLDFEDFVANAEIIDSTNVAGNPDLRPQTSWRMEAAADWRFDKPGALTLTLFYWSIGDALDFIIVDSPNGAFDARGNIGDAQMFGVRLSLDLPIGFVPGARIRSEGLVQVSEATDPLTGQRRAVSGIEESTLDVEFRQDLPSLALAWGATFESERVTPEFRLDLISLEREADELELWVESTRIRGLKLRAFAEVALADERRDRWFFGPDRAGVRDGAENRTRRLSPVIGISAEGSF